MVISQSRIYEEFIWKEVGCWREVGSLNEVGSWNYVCQVGMKSWNEKLEVGLEPSSKLQQRWKLDPSWKFK